MGHGRGGDARGAGHRGLNSAASEAAEGGTENFPRRTVSAPYDPTRERLAGRAHVQRVGERAGHIVGRPQRQDAHRQVGALHVVATVPTAPSPPTAITARNPASRQTAPCAFSPFSPFSSPMETPAASGHPSSSRLRAALPAWGLTTSTTGPSAVSGSPLIACGESRILTSRSGAPSAPHPQPRPGADYQQPAHDIDRPMYRGGQVWQGVQRHHRTRFQSARHILRPLTDHSGSIL